MRRSIPADEPPVPDATSANDPAVPGDLLQLTPEAATECACRVRNNVERFPLSTNMASTVPS